MEVSVRQIPSYRLACFRHPGKYSDVRDTWERVLGWAARSGHLGRGPMIAIVHEGPHETENCRYEAGVAVGRDVQDEETIKIQPSPAGLYAVAIHRGPYEELRKVYEAVIEEWLSKHGCTLRSGQPFLEIYLNSPRQVPERELITEICVPVDRVAEPEPEGGEESELGLDLVEPPIEPEEEEEEEEEEEAEEEAAEEEPATTRKGAGKGAPAAKAPTAGAAARGLGRPPKAKTAEPPAPAKAAPKGAVPKAPAKKAVAEKPKATKAAAPKKPAKKEAAPKKEKAKPKPAAKRPVAKGKKK